MCVYTHMVEFGDTCLPQSWQWPTSVHMCAHLSFQVWLIALSMMLSSSTHFLDDDVISHSLWLRIKHHCVFIHNLYGFLHSSFDGHLGCFHTLVPVTSTAVNMDVQVPLWHAGLLSFGYTRRSGGAGSWYFYFQLFEKCHTHLHGSYSSLHLTSII